mmetsp:Transcript_6817/g.9944  ORF Transcript_6817/g.9944 Transcript_6817/m.9944 type:complete len:414 (-) Transcript_6817:714-1955(-)|eukprot:CAMPEP_0117423168 /NCGR_PEP_ID=MMETSP0758-20121206/3851_1 /TAXON_ID=63605 /ORGANISM="Percolomonas cosmopolitus, Strain AE-1 (ATCC 50343)" /LENGTH=413 /DNA_ID=CAMNT_0005206205 /DNA_START=44 /DNA_END=1285 /DNA_ORIENTATION=-
METPIRAMQRQHEEKALFNVPPLLDLDEDEDDRLETFSKLEMVSSPRSSSRRTSHSELFELDPIQPSLLKIELPYEDPFRMNSPSKSTPTHLLSSPSPMARRRQFFNLPSASSKKSKISNLVNPKLIEEGKRAAQEIDPIVVEQDDAVAQINAKYTKQLAKKQVQATEDSPSSSRSTSQLTGWKTPKDIQQKENAKIHDLKTPNVFIVQKKKKVKKRRRPKTIARIKRLTPTKKKEIPKDELYKHLPQASFRSKTDRFASLGASDVPAAADYHPSDAFASNTHTSYQGASSAFKSQHPRFEQKSTDSAPLCYGQDFRSSSTLPQPPQNRPLPSQSLALVQSSKDLKNRDRLLSKSKSVLKENKRKKKTMNVKGKTTKSDLYQLFELIASNRNADARIDSLMSQIEEMEDFLAH